MRNVEDFSRLSDELEQACRATDGVIGLVLLGSAADATRRDEWSDHDFFVLLEPGREHDVRVDMSWLPRFEDIVLLAREGDIGFVVGYSDGHVFEFAAATTDELAGALADDALIVYDSDGSVARLIKGARERAESGDRLAAPSEELAVNDMRLVLVKLLIGVGRARRGELLNGSHFVRTWAVDLLVRVVRARIPSQLPSFRDKIDPLRRFERGYPELATRIDEVLAQDVEHAARGLFDLVREVLEPGWDAFPSDAADAVAARLDWRDDNGVDAEVHVFTKLRKV